MRSKLLRGLTLCTWLTLVTPIVRADVQLLNFENLTDLTAVGNFYAAAGIHFQNSISLTAGFSLNEFDYPPSSGVVAVGDSGGPLGLFFDETVTSLFAHFTYGSRLTFTAYSDAGFLSPIGTFATVLTNNLGRSDLIDPGFTGFRSLQIQGASPDTLIMDDLNYTTTSPVVPEPTSIALLATAIAGLGLVAGLRRRKRQTRILIGMGILVLSLSVFAPCSYANKGVFNAVAQPNEALINVPFIVTFTAEIGADTTNPLLPGSVALYETTSTGTPLSQIDRMYDDGTHGDVVAADTIFTTSVGFNETAPRTRYLRVTVAYTGVRNRYMSPVIPITFYPPPPATLVPQVTSTLASIQNVFTTNLSLGVGQARFLALSAALNNPNIGAGNANLNGPNLSIMYVYVDPATGYRFNIPGFLSLVDPANLTDGAGRSVPTNLPANYKSPGNDRLLIFGPGYNAPDPQNAIVEHAATQFNNTEYMTFNPSPPAITARESASLEVVKHWGDYGTIIIHTHGGLWTLGATSQVVLVTGTPSSFWNQLTYLLDLLSNRIGIAGDGRFVFYPSFITKYVSGMKNTFIYLGACESLQNDTLWNALSAKGAKVAFGWSQTVNRNFNGTTFAALIDPMLPHTNPPNPSSAQQAFNNVAIKTDPFGGFNATLTMRVASADWNNFFFAEGGIVNGDFETGDWTGWTHGGALSDGLNYQVVVGAQKHGGSWSGALGRWDTAFTGYNPTAEPGGYEWFYQDFVVPSNATKLSFWWWLETYDTAVWDWFDAYLQTTSGTTLLTLVNHGGKPGTNYGPYWNTGSWQYVEADVSAFRGQKLRIYFDQRLDGYGDQQRTYVDDVQVK